MADGSNVSAMLGQLVDGEPLDEQQAYELFEAVMSGGATDAQIGSLLTALESRAGGPSVDEIVGAARAMRAHVAGVEVPAGGEVVDTCGTGGVRGVSFNVSTTAALIAAGAGAHVAKHGNRAVTSRSGSAQVLEALGVNLEKAGAVATRCLAEARICFCFAVAHHPAMKHAIGPRKELGFRTIFNVLGPLTNPAGARRQLMGVWKPELTKPIAEVLGRLDAVHVMVVHGDNQDDITTTGPTQISTWREGEVNTETVTPKDFGLAQASMDELSIEGVEDSAAAVRGVLAGEKGAKRDIAALNAAAALVVAGLAGDMQDGLGQAFAAIDDGRAAAALAGLGGITNGGGAAGVWFGRRGRGALVWVGANRSQFTCLHCRAGATVG